MFLQVFHGAISDAAAVRGRFEAWMEDLAPGAEGWLGATVGATDDGQLVAVVRFTSEEAARRNSDRPRQGEWWSGTEHLFEGPVAFHDYPHTALLMGGGSDDAGFVQVLHGRSGSPEELSMAESEQKELAGVRPEIIGGSLGWSDDGSFTETIYFTTEEAARQGEAAMGEDPDLSEAQERWMSLIDEVRFLDLREPWLFSP